MKNKSYFIPGVLLGTGLMYFLDPNRGRQRRALARDKAIKVRSQLSNKADVTVKRITNKLNGVFASAKSCFTNETVSDKVLVDRVRSKLGRVTSHPREIEVLAQDGMVTLRGSVLESEANEIRTCLRSVPGVKELKDELTPLLSFENSASQGG